MLEEIRRHADEIIRRSNLTADELERLFGLVTDGIEVSPDAEFVSTLPAARGAIGERDPGDVPFLALALAVPCDGIWTQNVEHFEGAGAEVWTTADVIEHLRASRLSEDG